MQNMKYMYLLHRSLQIQTNAEQPIFFCNILTKFDAKISPKYFVTYISMRTIEDFITKTCPCHMSFFSAVKIENFIGKILIFFLFLLKTEIVGTS